MKTLMVLVFLFLIYSAFAGILVGLFDTNAIAMGAGMIASIMVYVTYYKIKSMEDDFLFLWVKTNIKKIQQIISKTKTKRLKERKNSAKEAMRKELEED